MPKPHEITEESFNEWHASAKERDPEAAFEIAQFGFERDLPGDRTAAEAWLERAARWGGAPIMWRAAELAKDYSTELAAHWQQTAIETEWRDSGVAIDTDTFRLYPFGGDSWTSQEFHVRIQGAPGEQVLAALQAAVPRLFCVGDDGVEYPDAETALDEADYSPNYVSEPEAHPAGGWRIWLDCKSEAYPLMAGTQLRILVDELRRAGVEDITIDRGLTTD